MKVEGLSDKAMKFRLHERHYTIPTVSDSGVLIRFVEIDDWVRVMIEVDEETTSDDLRAVVPLALSWRDRLLEWQGPWMKGGDNPFLEELSLRQEEGESYGALADRINQRVAELLQEYARYLEEYESIKHEFRTMLDFYMWRSKANQFSLDHARDLLRSVRVPDNEMEELIRGGLENARLDKPPFENGYPVSREKLISTLRWWRRGKKHQLVQQGRKQYGSHQ